MADTPVFTSQQFINAASLNTMVSNVSGSVVTLTDTTRFGGLVWAGKSQLSSNGLVVTAYLPPPFRMVFDDGTIAYAHGTTDGIDTQTYTVNFAPLVPVSGPPIVAYLILSQASVRLNQYAVVGPPPGHPDFNPNFQPYLAYGTVSDSIAVTASLTPPDNSATFELARVSLAVGATSVGNINTAYWQRSADNYHLQVQPIFGSVINTEQYSGKLIKLHQGGVFTLPALSLANSEQYFFSTTTTNVLSIVATATGDPFGPNLIYGTVPNPIIGYPGFVLTPGGAVSIAAVNGIWQIISGHQFARATMFRAMFTGPMTFYVDAQAGNDNNNGLSTGSAFQTLQAAHDYVKNNYDLGGYALTFSCNGNFNAGCYSGGPWVGTTGAPQVSFNFTAGSSVIAYSSECFLAYNYSTILVQGGVTLSSPVSGASTGRAVRAINFGRMLVGAGVNFGTCGDSHIRCANTGMIHIEGSYNITGDTPNHYSSDSGGVITVGLVLPDAGGNPISLPLQVTLVGSRTFSGAFATSYGGVINLDSTKITYSGVASGQRYSVINNGLINTLGSGPTYFPGTIAGTGTAYNSYI